MAFEYCGYSTKVGKLPSLGLGQQEGMTTLSIVPCQKEEEYCATWPCD
jgi:hypothetical protein